MNAISPVHSDMHAKVKINDVDMEHVADQHMAPLTLHEFVAAGAHYPIAFVKNSETGQFQAVCILSATPKQNNVVKDGRWYGGYVPLIVRNSPFCLILSEDNQNQFLIGIDETSSRVNLESGEDLFTAEGVETDYFQQRKQALMSYYEMQQSSRAITQFLVDLDLLQAEIINIKNGDNNISLNGIYILNEEKLNALPDEKFLNLRTKGLLPAIYAHMSSFHHLSRIVTFTAA